MFLLSLLPIFIILVLIIFAVVVVSKSKEGGESVIRHLYVYLVLFATLMMVIGGGISIFMATADLVSPPSYYQTFTDFKMMREGEKIEGQPPVQLTDEQLRAEYEQMKEDDKEIQRNNAKNQIIKSLGFIIIPLPIFIYFNTLRKKTVES
ncbi:hypothetical protein [Robertmurraya massiliosenegalensis]|uniref:hypothetical protein n=1 Tax=Robertmurraya massiliosenegalensis TaxID=1287657 RepID=UPI0002FC3ADF|nr:hypothetical protein [Robertmurraya massiliosenegalensis]